MNNRKCLCQIVTMHTGSYPRGLIFEEANGDWLDFVVANDSTLDVINDYMRGRFSKDIAVQLLLPQNLTDQYAFLTKEALALLKFEGSNIV